ncbi:MAG: hypothetical protein J6P98_02695, partial [Clostridia bacterium]|nr:hypothetical protein [Clostridia bacterium]
MAYNKNGGNGRVGDFKDGQPVYKRGRNNMSRPQAKRGEGRNEERGSRSGDGERRLRYNAESEGEGYRRRGEYVRGQYNRKDNSGEGEGFRRGSNRSDAPRRQNRGPSEFAPRRTYNNSGSRMEDFPHDINPHREREIRRDAKRVINRYDARPEVAETDVQPEELPNIIMGRTPVKEAIRAGRSIDRILVTSEHDGSLNEILDLARDAKLVVRDVDRAKLDEICMPFGHNGRTGNHQGIIAYSPGV